MAYNRAKLEQRLNSCDQELNNIFASFLKQEQMKELTKTVQTYYNDSYNKAKKNSQMEAIIKHYEQFNTKLNNVKNGTLSREEMLDDLRKNHNARKINVAWNNLTKMCELIFWASTLACLYTSAILIVMPLCIAQTALGIITAIMLSGLMLKSAQFLIKSLTEFSWFTRHSKANDAKKSLTTFFALPSSPTESESPQPFQTMPEPV